MKTASIVKPNQLVMDTVEKSKPAEDEVLIKVMACGICGTDIHIFRGEYLANYPVIPGHEFSGLIEEIGRKVTKYKPGDRVAVEPNIACDNCYNCLNNRQNFCLNWQGIGVSRPGAMAQYIAVPEKNVFPISDIPFEKAAFMEPLSCVLHGVQKAKISLSDKVALLGSGPIGFLILKIIQLQGASEVTIFARKRVKVEHALTEGADIGLTEIDKLERDYYDLVIDTTGAIPVMSRVIEFVRYGGTILLFGVAPKGKLMEVEPFQIFRKGLRIISSYTSVRNSYQAIELLKRDKIKIDDLISHKLPLEDLQKGIEMVERRTGDVSKVLIYPNET